MAVRPEGTPVWADAMFKDVEVAKTFYGDVLGWTFGESSSEFGNYTQAYKGGKAVAAVVPPMPGQDGEGQSTWCLYFASADVAATAEKIRAAGGTVLMEPMQVGDFGSMCIAQEPSGAVFGLWQAGQHEGFELEGESGSYAWAEVFTREPAKTDPFFTDVFGYGSKKMKDEHVDYRVFDLGGAQPVLGRMLMTAEDFPPEIPSYIQLYFAVDNCDKAVEAAQRLGGKKLFGPMDSPFGRFAAILDPQGATFAVIDLKTTVGEMPEME
ncbi:MULTISPECIES: VOC family protein [Streptomyces]|uniref:Hydroxylase n=1 Tax=Streptomyces venezuelae (strain ATCC 10712 / CBS 650.69 / DSM 40230 / JCM 4526 / NBRC 13096 / PD 04745) TaxID=953739 RepID=F2RKB9_STRVP|nr:VOC family protein [Streptomyces venezuelae]APE26630.1 hydrolase [Streptomyces venezuelae]QES04046.1 VOC family protein [Streptomyces venezuelae ATCC 10712]CCA60275.1 hydroxylase [Streptomyces venezuelae ATCC 10712]